MLDLAYLLNATDSIPTDIPAVTQTIQSWRSALHTARRNLFAAQARQIARINQNRTSREYKPGDQVMVSTRHIVSDNERARPANKWLPKFLGPFHVLKRISTNAYRIDFPQTIRVHKTVNIEALKEYNEPSPLHDPTPPPAPTVKVGGDIEYEVERIIDKRTKGRGFQYLVKWKGYPDHENEWISKSNLEHNAKDAIKDFETSHHD